MAAAILMLRHYATFFSPLYDAAIDAADYYFAMRIAFAR